MKVKELIEELQKHDPNKMVLITAYEEGYDELKKVVEIEVGKPRPNRPYWKGEYDDYPPEDCLTSAILLPRP